VPISTTDIVLNKQSLLSFEQKSIQSVAISANILAKNATICGAADA